jgi:hypothetical protein
MNHIDKIYFEGKFSSTSEDLRVPKELVTHECTAEVQTGFRAHTASCPMGTDSYLLGSKAAGV